MTVNGATSLENGPSTPKKLTVEELQVGGVPAKQAERWKAPEIVESALKNTTLTFRNPSNSNKKKTSCSDWKRLSKAWDLPSRDKLELTQKPLSGMCL